MDRDDLSDELFEPLGKSRKIRPPREGSGGNVTLLTEDEMEKFVREAQARGARDNGDKLD